MAEWLSSHTQLWQLGVSPVRIPGRTWHRSSGHAEVASHIVQLEGPTTSIYNYVLGSFQEKKKEKKDWQRMLAQVLIVKTKTKRKA